MFNQRFIQWNDLNMVLGLEIETKSFISCWAFAPNSTIIGQTYENWMERGGGLKNLHKEKNQPSTHSYLFN